MKEYGQFVSNLKSELKRFLSDPRETWSDAANKYADGLASEELRRLISIETRREYGAFFTNSILAKEVLNNLNPSFNSESVIYDPACGAGNLLIAVSDYMQREKVIIDKKPYLLGTDLHKEFVEAAQLRVEISFLLKQPDYEFTRNKKSYSIHISDGFIANEYYKQATHIIVNPPFNQIKTKNELDWAKGKVSAAALFLDRIIQHCLPGTSIIAILPDVLRSGSRYEKWRKMVLENCVIEKSILLGQFDKYTDVDVYAINLTKRINETCTQTREKDGLKNAGSDGKQTLKDLFDICVGPVVDNRDVKEGRLRKYIVSKGLIGWSIQTKASLTRKYKGKSFETPFVVIKRISRMSDTNRAVATIINSPAPVYVDNHLIVLKPRSGSMEDCQKAINLLKDKRTNDWLNKEIRCRHLTVGVVAKIPIWNL